MTEHNLIDENKYEAENLTEKLKRAIVRVDTNDYDSVEDLPFTKSDVESAIENVDIQETINKEKEEFTIEEYDGNGLGDLNDEKLRERNDITGDTAYLIETAEGKTFFQPFVPYVGGKQPLNTDNWETVADQHVEKKARQRAFGMVLAELKDYVDY